MCLCSIKYVLTKKTYKNINNNYMYRPEKKKKRNPDNSKKKSKK